eukprot:2902938-Pleurochrysis_carterae.AAC.1
MRAGSTLHRGPPSLRLPRLRALRSPVTGCLRSPAGRPELHPTPSDPSAGSLPSLLLRASRG